MIIAIDGQQHATIIAALRYYQQQGLGDPINRSDEIHDIATNMDEEISLDSEGIDALVAELQSNSTGHPIPNLESVLELLNDTINSYEDAGCEGCGTISSDAYNKLVEMRDRLTVGRVTSHILLRHAEDSNSPVQGNLIAKTIEAMSELQIEKLIDDAAEYALNAGCLCIQQAIKQTDGGIASVVFSGNELGNVLRTHFRNYFESERSMHME